MLAAAGGHAGGRRPRSSATWPTPSESPAVGCGGPAPSPLRRPGGGRPGRGVRRARDRRGLDARRRARGRLPGRRRCPMGADIEDYLATLGKKERHEIRRKVRRAEARRRGALDDVDRSAGRPRDVHRAPPEALGRRRPFPDTPGGAQSRVFFRRLFELHGPDGPFRAVVPVRSPTGASRPGSTSTTATAYLYYNAGVDPDARDLSPGVVMATQLRRARPRAGARRLDFLRGNEPYKYEWGAVDEPIQRILVRATRHG